MLRLRRARPDEGPALTALCLRSKASHGYDSAFLDACASELTVHPGKVQVVVAEQGGTCVGVVEISLSGEEAELEKLFVEPAHQGNGAGRVLFEWAVAEARKCGARILVIDSDPGAVAFYEKMGAVVQGKSASVSIPDRFLPRLRLELGDAEQA